jgi:hypothetical protein
MRHGCDYAGGKIAGVARAVVGLALISGTNEAAKREWRPHFADGLSGEIPGFPSDNGFPEDQRQRTSQRRVTES